MSTASGFDYEQSFDLTPPISSEAWRDVRFPVKKHSREEILRMNPDWETKKPVPFKEFFGCLGLTSEESEAFLQDIKEGREESRRFENERVDKERRDR